MHGRLYSLTLFVLTIAGCGGGGGGSDGEIQPIVTGPPSTPINVVAVGEQSSIKLDWTSSAHAAHYNMYWSEASGVNAQNGNKVVSVSHQAVIPDLRDDTIYYVVVTAENDSGESAESAEVQAQPVLSIPPRVVGVSAAPGDGDATLQWRSRVNADSYSVFVGTVVNRTGAVEMAATSNPFVVSGLTNGVTYYLSVAAQNEEGRGTPSQNVEATPVAPVAGWTPQTQINVPPCRLPIGFSCESTSSARVQDFAINEHGVAAVLWTHREGASEPSQLAVNHTASGTWGEQFILEGDHGFAGIAITPDGDIHVAYSIVADIIFTNPNVGYGGVSQKILWRRYRTGSWSDPIEIESPAQNLSHFFVRLATDDQGNVFATWVEGDWEPGASTITATNQLWARRFDAVADSWDDAVMIGESVGEIWLPTIAAGASNRAFVAWSQDTEAYDVDLRGNQPQRRVVYASRFDAVAWQPGTLVGRNDLVDWDDVTQSTLGVNSTGSGVVAWIHELSSTGTPDSYQVGAARYDAQLGQWSSPEVILDSSRRSFSPDVVINTTNESIVAWGDEVNVDVSSSNYDPTANLWGPVVSLPGLGIPYGIEYDGRGELVLAWASGKDPKGIFVSRLEPGSTDWSSSDHLGGYFGSSSDMRIKTASSGHTIIVNNHVVIRNEERERLIFATIYSP